MAFIGHIGDVPAARRASQSALIADTTLGFTDTEIATVAAAKAASLTQNATLQICDQIYGIQCSKGFQAASNQGATFGSTFTAFYDSLPSNGSHKIRFIA